MGQISLYLDEHIQLALAEALKARGVDVLRTQEAGNVGLGDVEQLAFVAENKRSLFHIINDTSLRFIMSGWH